MDLVVKSVHIARTLVGVQDGRGVFSEDSLLLLVGSVCSGWQSPRLRRYSREPKGVAGVLVVAVDAVVAYLGKIGT